MSSERKVAVAAGALYIVATVAGLLATAALGSLLDGPRVLAHLDAHETRVLTAAFFELVLAVAVAGIAFMIYPILKQDADTPAKQGLALWYVGTRVTESALGLVGILGLLSLFALSQEVARAHTAVHVLTTASDYSVVLYQTVFCVGAVMLYYLLHVSRRVPRWLTIWGLIGVPLFLVGGFSYADSGDPNSTFATIMYAPLFLQEMVLAVWLILKGWNPSASDTARTATGEPALIFRAEGAHTRREPD